MDIKSQHGFALTALIAWSEPAHERTRDFGISPDVYGCALITHIGAGRREAAHSGVSENHDVIDYRGDLVATVH